MSLTATVVVCTYNRCESLRDTLQALKNQCVADGLTLEIIIVDNNSTDRTKDVVQEVARESKWPLRYVLEPRQGKSYACNQGIRQANGEIIAFTDDDVIPDSRWIQALHRVFLTHNADCVGGKILPLWLEMPPEWLLNGTLKEKFWEIFVLLDHGQEAKISAGSHDLLLFGANMAFRKSVFANVGLFRTDLGPMGTTHYAHEDTEMLDRLFRMGKCVVYAPDAVVHHKIPRERMCMTYARRWRFNLAYSSVLLSVQKTNNRFPGWLMRECATNAFSSLLAYLRFHRELGMQRELMFWTQLGRLAGTVRLLRFGNRQRAVFASYGDRR